jgi:FkbM family methyltransferase
MTFFFSIANAIARIKTQGLFFTVVQKLRYYIGMPSYSRLSVLKSDGQSVWLRSRINTSDHGIFEQVFIEGNYKHVLNQNDFDLIIDAGANVGFSSAYFAINYPMANIIALEPEQSNYNHAKQNCSSFHNVHVIQGALWDTSSMISMSNEPYRGGSHCARVVSSSTGSIRAYTIGELLDRAPAATRVLIKMDIEGAESIIFRSDDDTWIDRTTTLAIELHPDGMFGDPTEIVHQKMTSYGFHELTVSETTYFSRMRFDTEQ